MFLPFLGALLWRIRGGLINGLTGVSSWHGLGDTAVRLIWAVGMALGFYIAHHHYAHFMFHIPMFFNIALLGVAFFCFAAVIGWFNSDLYPKTLKDSWKISLSGLLRSAFVFAVIPNFFILIGGALFGPAYWLGAKIPVTVPNVGERPTWQFWGEFIAGFVIGLSLWIV